MKEVRFGLIGLGAMGMAHAKTLLSSVPDARLCAAVTTSEAHKAELLALPGASDVRVFATAAEMYASGLIDAVLIATPHRLHVQQAVEAFRAGMHVLLEKPMGVSHAGGPPAKRGSGQEWQGVRRHVQSAHQPRLYGK